MVLSPGVKVSLHEFRLPTEPSPHVLKPRGSMMNSRKENEQASDAALTFGGLLRRYRESYSERLRKTHPEMPRVKLTALALIESMEKAGYSLSSGSYTQIENGSNFPHDPERFLETVTRCLLLDDAEYHHLARQLAHDVVRSRVGKKIADIAIPPVSN
jgi:hypothetical protein